MALGRLPDDDSGEGAIFADINITPLTDIFLVLLIIFMITSSAMVEAGPRVNLPEAGTTSTESKGVVVTVDSKEVLFVNGEETARDSLPERLAGAIAASEIKRVVLEGDREVILGDVVWILDQARTAGASEVAIAATRSGS
jgi:biopolymer transport protein ExbD